MASAEQVGLNKTWELSLYELHRTPQDVITDNTEIAVSPRSLHSELMCPICLDMLKKTMTTKECLHRFCSDCIITALRSGNKVRVLCYVSRRKLASISVLSRAKPLRVLLDEGGISSSGPRKSHDVYHIRPVVDLFSRECFVMYFLLLRFL